MDQGDNTGVLLSDTYYGRRISSSFETSTDVDDYRVSLDAGDVVMVSAIPLSNNVDTVLEVLTKKGNAEYLSYTVDSRSVMIRDDDSRSGWDYRGSEIRFVAPVSTEYIIRVYPYGLNVDSMKGASESGVVKSGSGTTGEYELDVRWFTGGLRESVNPELE